MKSTSRSSYVSITGHGSWLKKNYPQRSIPLSNVVSCFTPFEVDTGTGPPSGTSSSSVPDKSIPVSVYFVDQVSVMDDEKHPRVHHMCRPPHMFPNYTLSVQVRHSIDPICHLICIPSNDNRSLIPSHEPHGVHIKFQSRWRKGDKSFREIVRGAAQHLFLSYDDWYVSAIWCVLKTLAPRY